jgi:hypothetical protein
VQFTRDPAGLRNALVKIGSLQGSRMSHPNTEEVAHMLFAPGMTRWFATHPPLVERIRALDPSFDPAEFRNLPMEVKPQPLGVMQVAGDGRLPDAFADPSILERRSVRLEPASLPGHVANPGTPEIAHARALQETLPRDWARTSDRESAAAALLLALVLDSDAPIRVQQLQKVRLLMGNALEEAVEGCIPRVQRLAPEQRLPMLGGIIPILRGLPRGSRQRLLDCLAAMSRVDGAIQVFEYALAALARVYLDESLEPRRRPRSVGLRDVTIELQTVFSTLAANGHPTDPLRERAYADGIARMRLERAPPYRPVPGWASALDRALRCLDGLASADKAMLVEALGAVVVHDGQVTVAEGELLRAICATIHCPLPPLL